MAYDTNKRKGGSIMSNRLLNKAWTATNLSPAEKLLLVRLADRADNDGRCWPSQHSLATDCGLTDRSVRDGVRSLAAKGHITIAESVGRTDKGVARFAYEVHPLTPENASAVTEENNSPVTPEIHDSDTGNPRQRQGKSFPLPIYRNPQRTHREPSRGPAPSKNPSLEMVKLQAAKIGLSDHEAEKFFHYYSSNGWKVGKNIMRSWTHALSGWKLKNETNHKATPDHSKGF
jgi:hypothetical protein